MKNINGNEYCDGALLHVIPVDEIKNQWNTCSSLDIMLCYPTTYEEYTKTFQCLHRFKLQDSLDCTLTSAIWGNMNRDLNELEFFWNMERGKLRTSVEHVIDGKRIRLFSPTKGIYTDVVSRTIGAHKKLFAHGREVIQLYIKNYK